MHCHRKCLVEMDNLTKHKAGNNFFVVFDLGVAETLALANGFFFVASSTNSISATSNSSQFPSLLSNSSTNSRLYVAILKVVDREAQLLAAGRGSVEGTSIYFS